MKIIGMIGWKLYYDNGDVYSSKESTWEGTPSEGVQILIVYYKETYKIIRDGKEEVENCRDMYFGKDYYWQFGNGQVLDVPEDVLVKLGKEITQEDWRKIYNLALKDTSY